MKRALLSLVLAGLFSSVAAAKEPSIDFDRQIRPILVDNCFHCHGPDQTKREAELRLDTKEGMFAPRDEGATIVSGKSDQSLLYQRLITDDEDGRMPPADSGRKLTPKQIDLVRQWIDQGAQWQEHWAFVAPKRPTIPKVKNPKWVRNEIDAFVLARLQREGLAPSAPAGKAALIRRVSLDLTGIPPTLQEVDDFLADKSPQAYEKLVDRLLKSPRYGERMAIQWLDAARYADTSGYQNDGPRYMWRWRDWVIESFNNNKPFDQFTVEQIAGDMLPHATLDQKIATGFNRNHRGNAEGGIIPEEFQVEYVVDRVETTSTVFLGLTMGCVRCHEHKFDPIENVEFYRMFAYFNNIPESGRAVKEGNSPPLVKAPTREQQKQLAALKAKLVAAEKRFAALQKEITTSQQTWEKSAVASQSADWSVTAALVAHYPLDGKTEAVSLKTTKKKSDKKDDKKKSAETIGFNSGQAKYAGGKLGKSARFDGKRYINSGDVGNFGYFDKFSLAAWVYAQGDGTIVSRMTDAPRADGYYVQLVNGHIQVNLVKRWLDDSIRIETESTLTKDRWHHIAVTYDGSRVAKGITVYVDGRPQKMKVHLDGINQTFGSDQPLRIGGGGGEKNRFHGQVDDVRVYEKCLSPQQVEIVATPDSIQEILALPVAKRSQSQAAKLRAFFLAVAAPKSIRKAYRQLTKSREQLASFEESLPTVMVMQELVTRKQTYFLKRGEYDKLGDKVDPGVPAALNPLPEGAPNNRLGLARWLVDPANPLTARVTVNRFWQMYFGTGIVKTTEDFGTQGERPSHQQLLDYLATEFVRSGWDVKALQKRIVTSAAYRQSSRVTPRLLEKDPENRLLARGPRIRMPAEMIRDQALAASGLLAEKIGGPSVKPYQPAGLWKEIATTTDYDQSHGDDLHRRSLYTFLKRTVSAPTMATFDAAPREFCQVRRPRTNTPLQALTLLNDVTYVEAARVLAQRVMTEADQNAEARLTLAYRLVLTRKPSETEMKILRAGLQRHLQTYREDKQAAGQLLSNTGEAPRDERLDVAELAAYTAVCSLIFNLDEAITKE